MGTGRKYVLPPGRVGDSALVAMLYGVSRAFQGRRGEMGGSLLFPAAARVCVHRGLRTRLRSPEVNK